MGMRKDTGSVAKSSADAVKQEKSWFSEDSERAIIERQRKENAGKPGEKQLLKDLAGACSCLICHLWLSPYEGKRVLRHFTHLIPSCQSLQVA